MAYQKLIQVYATAEQKAALKEFVEGKFTSSNRMNKMSRVLMMLAEIMVAAEEEIDFDSVRDETTFKKAITEAIKSTDTEEIVSHNL